MDLSGSKKYIVDADEDLREGASVTWISDKNILHNYLVFENEKQF